MSLSIAVVCVKCWRTRATICHLSYFLFKIYTNNRNNFMAKLRKIQIHYLSSKSAAVIVLSNKQSQAHVELDDSCVKS